MNGLRFHAAGLVQGVGFRAFTRRTALRLGVRGWVRNRHDGAVEGEAEGEAEALEAFVVALHQGPPGGRVDRVRVEEQPASGAFADFSVKR